MAALKGKTTQQKSPAPTEEELLPRRLNPQPETLLVDLFFVDGEGYLISRTEPGRLMPVDRIHSKKSKELESLK